MRLRKAPCSVHLSTRTILKIFGQKLISHKGSERVIFESRKVIFLHYPKTGGNSIQDALRDYSEDSLVIKNKKQDGKERFELRSKKYPKLTKHSNLNQYKKAIGRDFINYKIFCTTRNPWDRLISFYFSPHSGRTQWQREEFVNFIKSSPTLEDYIWVKKYFFLGVKFLVM